MNYKRIYDDLIESRKNRILLENVYYEKHHIIPKCMGGSNTKDNIVILTLREHFIAHKLLFKITTNKDKQKMGYALHRMCFINNSNQNERIRYTSKKFEKEKTLIYEHNKGENHPCYGSKRSESIKHKCSVSKIGDKNPMYGKKAWNNGLTKETSDSIQKYANTFKENYKEENHPMYGKNVSDETKEKISSSLKGKPKSDQHKLNLSKANLGKKLSDETKEKLRISSTGKKQEIVKCPHCGKEGGKGGMIKWHFDNCKYKLRLLE